LRTSENIQRDMLLRFFLFIYLLYIYSIRFINS